MRSKFFIVFCLVCFIPVAVKADPVFSNVQALQLVNGAITRVSLFDNPGVGLRSSFPGGVDYPVISIQFLVTGMTPGVPLGFTIITTQQGITRSATFFTGPAPGSSFVTGTALFLPDTPYTAPDGSLRPGAFTLFTIDFPNYSPDFRIPGGPNAGQFVNSYTFSFNAVRPTPSPVPEPATMTLLGLGLAGIGGMVKRRRKAKSA